MNLCTIHSGMSSSQSWEVVVTVPLPVFMVKYPNQSNFNEIGFVLPHRPRTQSIMVGKSWKPELKAAMNYTTYVML